jgi:hypothetical protein
MLGKYRVSKQLGIFGVVLSSIELVFLFLFNKHVLDYIPTAATCYYYDNNNNNNKNK